MASGQLVGEELLDPGKVLDRDSLQGANPIGATARVTYRLAKLTIVLELAWFMFVILALLVLHTFRLG